MKKNFVRILTLVMPLVLVFSLMTACGQQKTDGNTSENAVTSAETKEASQEQTTQPAETKKEFANKKLEIAVFEGGYGKVFWEAVVEKFEKDYPGVEVTLISTPKIDDVVKPRIIAGNPPDFLNGGTGDFATAAREGVLAPLNDVFDAKALDTDSPLKDKIIDGYLDWASPLGDGVIYGAPSFIGAQGMLYNQELFAAKGWQVPKTWDEFFALGDTAKKDGIALYTYQGIYPGYNGMVLMSSIASHAGMDAIAKIFNYEEGAWKDPKVKEVLGIFEKIAKGNYLMKGTTALNHTQSQTEFINGKALFLPCGNWFENEMKDVIPATGFKYGFISPPAFSSGEQQYVSAGGELFTIPAKAKNMELAKEFMSYLYTDEIAKLQGEKSTGIACIKGVTEMVKDYVPISSYETMNVFNKGVKPLFDKWKVTPPTEVKISDEIYNSITSIMNGKMTVDQWVERIEAASAKLREAIASAK
ncbi:MAG: carbohydrate ABC transporter substrate-binding protein [Clostridiales bacterium GWC2_40_7]|nr:MAG: carbohydrate ABC transporter substrate-binding protein [Clostridiales bacterium GWC2_40_7]